MNSSRVTANMLAVRMLSDINTVRNQMARAQEQMTTGRRVMRPSDDPSAVARVLSLHEQIERNEQYLSSASQAEGFLAHTDTAIQNVIEHIHKAREIAMAGAGAIDSQARDTLADQLDQVIDAIKGEMNTTHGDLYVFSGTRTDTPPYRMGADDSYYGNTTSPTRDVAPNTSVEIGIIGQDAIGTGAAGLLKTLRDLAGFLRADDVSSITQTSIPSLKSDLDTMLSSLSVTGARQHRVQIASDRLEGFGVSLELARSDEEDADFARVATEYNIKTVSLQAALQSAARLTQNTLLDYLN